MDNVTKITTGLGEDERVETGPIQFDDDWPGIFIRGDVAISHALIIENYLNGDNTEINEMYIKNLARLLKSCIVKHNEKEDE